MFLNALQLPIFVLVTVFLVPVFTHAQSDLVIKDRDEGRSIKIGHSDFYPELVLGFVQSGNGFNTKNGEVVVQQAEVSPSFSWVAEKGQLKLWAKYRGKFSKSSEEELDFLDHLTSLNVSAELSKRSRGFATFEYDYSHVTYGTGVGRGIDLEEQIVFGATKFRIEHTYGAKNARGNIKTGLTVTNREYLSHATLTTGLDYVETRPYFEFSYRMSSDARLFAEYRYSSIDFESDYSDRGDHALYGGIRWETPGKSGGSVAVGSKQSKYIDISRGESNTIVAEAEIYVLPLDFSKLSLSASRNLFNADWNQNADGLDYRTIQDALELSWDHQWSSRLAHRAQVGLSNYDRECVFPGETVTSLSANAEYAFRRWIIVGIEASLTRRRQEALCDLNTLSGSGDDFESSKAELFFKITL